jgi:hypothetical protein
MFSSTETTCVYGITIFLMMTFAKNILHFIMETYEKLDFFLCLKMHHAMEVYGRLDMQLHIFLTLAQYEDKRSVSFLVALPPNCTSSEPGVVIWLASQPVWVLWKGEQSHTPVGNQTVISWSCGL